MMLMPLKRIFTSPQPHRCLAYPLMRLIKNPLRQKGKVADLACIAKGELVLTDSGLVPIEKITIEHKLWDSESFVSHDGLIYKGIKKVISYQGYGQQKIILYGERAGVSHYLSAFS